MNKTTDDSFGLNNLTVGTINFKDGTQLTTSMDMTNYPTLNADNVFTGTNNTFNRISVSSEMDSGTLTSTGLVTGNAGMWMNGTSTIMGNTASGNYAVLNFISTSTTNAVYDARIWSNAGSIGTGGSGQLYVNAGEILLNALNSMTLTAGTNITCTGAMSVSGLLTTNGGIQVNGSHTITGGSSCTGNSSCGSSTVVGNETVGGTEIITGLLTANGGLTLASAQKITFGDATQQTTAFIPANIPTLVGSNVFTGATNTFNAITCTGETDTGNLTANAITSNNAITANGLLSGSLGLSVWGGDVNFGRNITLINSASAPITGQLGYVIIGALALTTPLTSGTIFNSGSVTLPAYGTWQIIINVLLKSITQAQSLSAFVGGYSTVDALTTPVIGQSISVFFGPQVIPATGYITQNANFIITSTISQTYFLNMNATFTGVVAGGTLNCYGGNYTFIKAVRIA